MNLQETHLLKRLDEKCKRGNPVEIGINETVATIRCDRSGYIASVHIGGQVVACADIHLASSAFLKLVNRIKRNQNV